MEVLGWALLVGLIVGPLALVRWMDRRSIQRTVRRHGRPREPNVDLRARGGSKISYHLGGHEGDHFPDIWGSGRRR